MDLFSNSDLTRAGHLGCLLLACAALNACGSGSPMKQVAPRKDQKAPPVTSALPGNVNPPEFCTRPGDDAVRDVFCGEKPARISGITELQNVLGVGFDASGDAGTNGYDVSAYAVVDFRVVALGHSTALSGTLVSPINPRVIVIGANT